jgi:two-component system chemotaxis response regulator CheY
VLADILDTKYNVLFATTGAEAIQIASATPKPDLIFLDVMMPGMDGYEVCRQLKESVHTRDIPVIFVTALDEVNDEKKGFELGAADYIHKPINAPILLARVNVHIAKKAPQRSAPIKLLIVDDVEDNRLVLQAICRKMNYFEIYEAINGQDAVQKCQEIHPQIVLMDIMMPHMDGFQATKIIKKHLPDTIVMAITAVMDSRIQEAMSALGIEAYIEKPVDKELIRFKLHNIAEKLRYEPPKINFHPHETVVNPFSKNIRSFKTLFHINSDDTIMDFGIWLMGRFECTEFGICIKLDMLMNLIYKILHYEINEISGLTFTVEESFDELFILIPLIESLHPDTKMGALFETLGSMCEVGEKWIAFRLPLKNQIHHEPAPLKTVPLAGGPEKREVGIDDRLVLRESYTIKITAKEYILTIDNDAFGEVSDLRETQEEWERWLDELKYHPTAENLNAFADNVLETYARVISKLYEFSGLSYALISLATLVKSKSEELSAEPEKLQKMLLFLRYFKNDLSSWIEHLFELQDTQDIHYLDASFFSSCLQIETVINGTEFESGTEAEIEFF